MSRVTILFHWTPFDHMRPQSPESHLPLGSTTVDSSSRAAAFSDPSPSWSRFKTPPFFPTSRIVTCPFAAWWPMSPWWSIVSAHRIPIPHLCRTIWLTANLWLTSPIRIAQTSVSFSICTRSYATLIQSLVCKGRRSNSLSLEIGQPVQ